MEKYLIKIKQIFHVAKDKKEEKMRLREKHIPISFHSNFGILAPTRSNCE